MTMYKDLTKNKIRSKHSSESFKRRREVFREEAPWKLTYKNTRGGARKRGIEFNITEEYIKSIWNDVCPVLGIPLKANASRYEDNSFSLDRIDNTKGYIEGNVVIISNRANKLKNNASLDELRKIVKFLESY